MNRPLMMKFSVPDDPELLRAFGVVSIRHAHLDYTLRMTIKALAETTPQEALDATAFQGSAMLRDRIDKLAKSRPGEGTALIRLQAILERCRRVTERRNELTHSVIARNLDMQAASHEPQFRTHDHNWKALPTLDDLGAVVRDIDSLIAELNTARVGGFISEALERKAK